MTMYLVTKRIEFCYGHRLLDYDGICKHRTATTRVAEIEVRTDRLDSRNMVAISATSSGSSRAGSTASSITR